MTLIDRRLLFVTGKGGVGKTSVAAALALLASRQGKRTLVCEVEASGALATAYETGPLAYEPREVQPRLWAMALSTEESLKEYLRLYAHVPLLGRIGPVARAFDFVANAAPGVKEILTTGKFAYEVRARNFDLVVVDAPATGHVVAQLSAPSAIRDLVKLGPVREQADWMERILADPRLTGAVLVTVPEEMAVVETIELAEALADETKVQAAAVIVNRVLPELFGRSEEEIFRSLQRHEPELVDALGEGATKVLDAADLAVRRRRTRAGHIADMRSGLPPGIPVLYLPELFARGGGVRFTGMLADALGEEIP